MARFTDVLLVGLLCLVAANAQQLNCASLGIADMIRGNSSTPLRAMSGSNLPYCRTSDQQCCTANYLMRYRSQLDSDILSSLREQLLSSGNFEALSNIQEGFQRYINDEFVDQFIDGIPGVGRVTNMTERRAFVDSIGRMLKMNFMINVTRGRFNVSGYLGEVTERVNELLLQVISQIPQLNINATQRMCISNAIRGAFNRTRLGMLADNIDELRRVATSLFRYQRWYRNVFIERLANFRPLEQCVARFITLRCAACRQDIARICRPRCMALVRGCLSPFQEGLRGQLNLFWNVTRQIINRGSRILTNIGDTEQGLIDADISDQTKFVQFAIMIGQRCGVTIGNQMMMGGRRRRQVNMRMMFRAPNGVMGNATRLNGNFQYGTNGPLFCRNNPVINCWNGNRTVDRDSINFVNDSIRDQGRNPALPFNVTALAQQARQLGTPVSDFLASDEATEVIPREVTVPEGMPYNGTTGTDPGNSASMIQATPFLLLLLFAALAALF